MICIECNLVNISKLGCQLRKINNNWHVCRFQLTFEQNTNYHSFIGPNVCLARLQMELAGPQIYLQPAKIKSQHLGVSLKFLVCIAYED